MSTDAPSPWSSPGAGDGPTSGRPADPYGAPPATGAASPQGSWSGSQDEAWRTAPPPSSDQWSQATTGRPAQGTAPGTGWPTQTPGGPTVGWDTRGGGQTSSVGQGQPWAQSQQAPNPYGTAPHGATPYGADQSVVYAYRQVEERNGTVPLVLALIALLVSLGLSVLCYVGMRDFMPYADSAETGSTDLPQQAMVGAVWLVVGFFGQLIPTILGIMALVLGARAMSDPSAKGKATAGIAVAVGAPVVSFIVFMALAMQIPGIAG